MKIENLNEDRPTREYSGTLGHGSPSYDTLDVLCKLRNPAHIFETRSVFKARTLILNDIHCSVRNKKLYIYNRCKQLNPG